MPSRVKFTAWYYLCTFLNRMSQTSCIRTNLLVIMTQSSSFFFNFGFKLIIFSFRNLQFLKINWEKLFWFIHDGLYDLIFMTFLFLSYKTFILVIVIIIFDCKTIDLGKKSISSRKLFRLNFRVNLFIVVINLECSNIRKAYLLICIHIIVDIRRWVWRFFIQVVG